MGKITLQEYSSIEQGNSTRILLYPNPEAGTNVLTLYVSHGAKKLCIHKCLEGLPDRGKSRLALPHELFAELYYQVTTTSSRTVVVGLDAYLSLLDNANLISALRTLYRLVDKGDLNVVFLLSSRWSALLSENFHNPKYENAMQLVSFEGDLCEYHIPKLTLIPDKWHERGIHGFSELLSVLVEFEPVAGSLIVGVSSYSVKQAGINDSITQIISISEYMQTVHGVDVSLPDSTLEYILMKSHTNGLSALDAIKSDFGISYGNTRLAPKRLTDCSDETIWAAYVWMLRKITNNNTYLHQVLNSANLSRDNFCREYVVTSAAGNLKHVNSVEFASERYSGLREMADDAVALVREFIDITKETPNDDVIPWLNNGTVVEHTELIRRVAKIDITGGLPKNFAGVYSHLSNYLSDDYDYGDTKLNRYFSAYRRLKVQNTVTEDFAKLAYDMIPPGEVPSRNSMLQELVMDTDTALLVVDGMGAEYLPLLLALAKRRGINVQSYGVAKAELPSSTEYNPITWDVTRKITGENGEKEIKSIDNIAHVGVAKGESTPFERNFAAVLEIFSDEVLKRISRGMSNFARVVVTSDHGSSRLAVLAHNIGWSRTLDTCGEVLDWRFTKAVNGQPRPPELVPTLEGFWIVRGYNRLPKSGGKFNELHGGATLEEQLVPVIVFSKEKVSSPPIKLGDKVIKQIVDKMEFDDI